MKTRPTLTMTEVTMPQMGESIAEGTIVRWIKKVGDTVDRDEPLFEISTDKVDAEIPAPAAGVLTEIKVQEGETVPVNAVVPTIGQAGEQPAVPRPGSQETPSPARPDAGSFTTPAKTGAAQAAASTQAQGDGQPAPTAADAHAAPASAHANGRESSDHEERRQKSSPLVRRIAREHNVDITQLHGSGIGGRVTKNDILGFLEHKPAQPAAEARPVSPPRPVPAYEQGERVDS